MKITKGGPGNVAPYLTTHVRVPVPIKTQIESQIAQFKRRVDSGVIVLNGNEIWLQGSIDNSVDIQRTLILLDEFMVGASRVKENSERNANLRNFRKWLQDKTSEVE
jgi:hypothetical protein